MSKVRPVKEGKEVKLLGKNVLVFLNFGEAATYELPKWALIGGQRSANYNVSAEEIDLTDKTSGGYGDFAPGIKTIELSLEIIAKPNDESIKELYTAFEKDEPIDMLRWAKDGRSVRNWYSITSIEETASYDDAVVMSMTLKGKGAPTYEDNKADPRE